MREDSLDVPIIEFCGNGCGYGAVPVVALHSCERTEKEWIIRLAAYTVTVTFALPESFETEEQCYCYCAAICRAIKEQPTLSGVVDRTQVLGEKYTPPKTQGCGESWCVSITLRVTLEERD